MSEPSEQNLLLALSFERQLRGWFLSCGLNESQTENGVMCVYRQLWDASDAPLAEELLHQRLFVAAEAHVLKLRAFGGSADSPAPALPEKPRLPAHVPTIRDEFAELGQQFQSVKALSPRCYQIFHLFQVNGLSVVQIAEQLGLPKAQVEQALVDASHACTEAAFGCAPNQTPKPRATRGLRVRWPRRWALRLN